MTEHDDKKQWVANWLRVGPILEEIEAETLRHKQYQLYKNMRKLRLYLDTSVISMLEPSQDAVRRVVTNEFCKCVANQPEQYETFISPVTESELADAPDEKEVFFASFLLSFPHTVLPENGEVRHLSTLYVTENVLSERHIDDLRHVAYAVLARCDYIVSWNMRHLVNPRTMSRVNDINALNRYPTIAIVTPSFFIGDQR